VESSGIAALATLPATGGIELLAFEGSFMK